MKDEEIEEAGWDKVNLKLKLSHDKEDTALTGNVEIRDNRELFRKKENTGQTCRVCGSPDVHTMAYNVPTMGCVEYLREALKEAEAELTNLYWEKYPDTMGK
jgi:hypothetical protein